MRKPKWIIKKCKICWQEYYVWPCLSKWRREKKYCSKKCSNKWKLWVNNPIHKIKNREEVNRKISQWVLNSEKHKIATSSNEFREKKRRERTWKIASEETRKKCRINALNTLQKMRDNNKISWIERMVEWLLIKMWVNFEQQKNILNITRVDFYLPEKNTIIYCDWDYWHNLPSYVERDNRINKELRKNWYTVLRFWEHDILKSKWMCVIDSLINV